MYMIRSSWDMLRLYCGCHGELKKLKMEITPKGPCYICKEEKAGIPCKTQITTEEYEEILSHISNLIVESELDSEVVDLTHTTWKTKKGTSCRVLLQKNNKISIMVDPRKRQR